VQTRQFDELRFFSLSVDSAEGEVNSLSVILQGMNSYTMERAAFELKAGLPGEARVDRRE
jgi:hypothetical protein